MIYGDVWDRMGQYELDHFGLLVFRFRVEKGDGLLVCCMYSLSVWLRATQSTSHKSQIRSG